MAYTDQNANITSGRTAAVITVAGLHGMALFGLVTGLGVTYVTEKVPIFRAASYKAEPPPPPPEKPPESQRVAKTDTVITGPVIEKPLPPQQDAFIVDIRPPLPPLGDTAGSDRLIELRNPVEPPPSPTPRVARPRNDPAYWVTPDDYPSADLRAGRQGTVQFEVSVGDDGRAKACRVVQSSGAVGLDEATCRNIVRRARFDPATDGTGARVASTYSGTIRWVIPGD